MQSIEARADNVGMMHSMLYPFFLTSFVEQAVLNGRETRKRGERVIIQGRRRIF